MKNLDLGMSKLKIKRKSLVTISVIITLFNAYGNTSQKNIPKKSSVTKLITKKADITISKKELDIVADKVFKNEAGGVKDNLVYWNTGENFPSLGIGHFIWYKEKEKGIFEESFPPLAPWSGREELMKLKNQKNKDIEELTEFLYKTKDIQIEFIFKRLEASLDKMLKASKNKENVRKQFYRVANSPNGLYPLIDYVNFKGEGTNPDERYKGQGWGLLQVLENMKGTGSEKATLVEFSNSAKFVLQRRVDNSDPSRNEKKWLEGWFKRCDTYKE